MDQDDDDDDHDHDDDEDDDVNGWCHARSIFKPSQSENEILLCLTPGDFTCRLAAI